MPRFNRYRYRRRHRNRGFTLIETIILVAVLGVIALMAVPSFTSMLDSIKLDQSISEIRSEISSTKRQAIRSGQSCVSGVRVQNSDKGVISSDSTFQSVLLSNCTSQEKKLPEGINLVSNIIPGEGALTLAEADPTGKSEEWWSGVTAWTCQKWGWFCSSNDPAPTKIVDLVYNSKGKVQFGIASDAQAPVDPTGKFVAFVGKHPEGKKKCLAISRRMGIVRIGNYIGSFDPVAMTDSGVCTSISWKKQ